MGASMGGGGDDDGGMIADINVTPLVDVTLVLLIIMMVTAPMLSEPTAIKVDLPKGKTGEAAGPPGEKGRTLLVGKGGQIQMDGAMITVEQLKERLAGETKLKPDIEIGVAADKGAEYGSVIQVLDTIRSAGVTKFSLQMEGEQDAAAIGAALGAGLAPGAAPGTAPVAPGAIPAGAPVDAGAAPVAAPGAPAAPAAAGAAPAAAPAAPAAAPATP